MGSEYREKICVHDEHPIAGRDIQCRAHYSQSSYPVGKSAMNENSCLLFNWSIIQTAFQIVDTLKSVIQMVVRI